MKTHYEHGPHGNACGRVGNRSSTDVYRVDCLNCLKAEQFIEAKRIADEVRQAKFEAQVPRTYREPWGELDNITCRICNGDKFRIGPRGLYGHYENYHCAECGHVESRLTEIGMSF